MALHAPASAVASSSDAKTMKKKKNAKKRARTIDKQDVGHSSLPWSAVDLPQEAIAGAGQGDEEFFQGFSVNDDDYMGLTEVSGVEVVRDLDGLTKFVVGKSKGSKADAEQGTSRRAKEPRTGEKKSEGDGREKKELDVPSASELPLHTFANEHEDDGSDRDEGDDEAERDAELSADFALLDDDYGTNAAAAAAAGGGSGGEDEIDESVGRWTEKDVAKMLPAWKKLDVSLHNVLYEAIQKASFTTPTAIQASTLPIAIGTSARRQMRDVVGIAQTGSGKTLAYGLPVLHWIASNSPDDRQMRLLDGVPDDETSTRLAALVLTPTRELAIQVAKHLSFLIESSSSTNKRWASVATITGGMSEEKQRRMLQGYKGRGVDIVVATPGRLWDICKGDDAFVRRVKQTRFLVVDEADRMIETGHFAELQHIFALVQRFHNGDDGERPKGSRAVAKVYGGAEDMQTFIYSATLSKDLQNNLKRANRRKRKLEQLTTLDELFEAIDFRDDEPVVVDQSTSTRMADNVFEVKAECLQKDKDLYLYYFLLRFPGRTLVFVNAIDGIRRLQPLLTNLGIAVQPLHSQLQQKQRLKNMDRFRKQNVSLANGGSSVLLATDVAARGLDIADVDHVVHFQIPRTADTYVHRSGRTARAGNKGVSLALVDPTEKRVWHALCKSLQRAESSMPSMPIEYAFLPELRQRVELARKMDKVTHEKKKEAHDDAWLRKLAEEADLAMSDEDEKYDDDEGGGKRKGGKASSSSSKGGVNAIQAQLRQMLQTPLRARGISFRYITSGSRDFLQGLLQDQQHGKMIGVQRSSLQADIEEQRTNAGKTSAKRPLAKIDGSGGGGGGEEGQKQKKKKQKREK